MENNSNHNSEKLIQSIIDSKINNDFNAEAIYKINKEIEKKMEEFDMEKRKQMAHAADVINKLIINA